MPSRRDQIKLTDEELAQLLDEERVVTVASFGPRGWPHLMPMWFTTRDGEVWIWTFAKSQKVRNLERDPRATLQVEAGDEYDELRGAMIEAEAVIERDPDTILEFGTETDPPLQRRRRGGRPEATRPGGGRDDAGAGGQARRDPLRPRTHRELGPPQARRHVLKFRLQRRDAR